MKMNYISNNRYVLSGAVFHHGQTFQSGHYTAYVQDGNHLFHIDDTVIRKRDWPNNSKDVYMLFYSRINVN